ncbi:mediator complex, subunit Med18 [Nemania sp. FL0916]|nr:mediator complex, subunit Med18 [Nemania sp. FL0916]
MHELFLTASVKQSDFDTACAVLQGLSWMTARRTVYRVLYFAGPSQPKGLSVAPPPSALPRAVERQLWGDLHKQLLRSSYILQAAYEVAPETDFGRDVAMDFNRLPATLRWTDLPDPVRGGGDGMITSRKKIEIPFRHLLPKTLTDNKLVCTAELIQESYSFNRGDLEIVLSRYYHLPSPPSSDPPPAPGSAPGPGRPTIAPILPAWTDLRPADSAQKWVLNVKLYVPEDGSGGGGQPEKVAQANDELVRNKAEFEKLFNFKHIDRRVFDTRIAAPPVVPGRGPTG